MNFLFAYSQTRRGIPLRISINKENTLIQCCEGCRQIDTCRRLAYPTLLIGDSRNASHGTMFQVKPLVFDSNECAASNPLT